MSEETNPRRKLSPSMAALKLKGLYTVGELTKAAAVPRRLVMQVFEDSNVQFIRVGRMMYVSLSELAEKVRPLWLGIAEAERLRHARDDW